MSWIKSLSFTVLTFHIASQIPVNLAVQNNTFVVSISVGQESGHSLTGSLVRGYNRYVGEAVHVQREENLLSRFTQLAGRTNFPVVVQLRLLSFLTVDWSPPSAPNDPGPLGFLYMYPYFSKLARAICSSTQQWDGVCPLSESHFLHVKQGWYTA